MNYLFIVLAFACVGASGLYLAVSKFSANWRYKDKIQENSNAILEHIRCNNVMGVMAIAIQYGWYDKTRGLLPPLPNRNFPVDFKTLGKLYGFLYVSNIPLGFVDPKADVGEWLCAQLQSKLKLIAKTVRTWPLEEQEEFFVGTELYTGSSDFRDAAKVEVSMV